MLMMTKELHSVIFSRNVEEINRLIADGVSPDYKDRRGRTLLSLAAACGYVDMAEALIKQGADINLNNQDDLGYTPLIESSREGKPEMVKYLVEKGADLERGDTRNGTALLHAVISAHSNILEILIDAGANVNTTDTDGNTPLHYLSQYAKKWGSSVTTYAIVNGKREEIKPEVSRYQKHLDIARMLLEHKAAPEAKNRASVFPMHEAAASNSHEMIALLAEYGADINKANKLGFAPIHAACRNGQFTTVKYLISQSIDLNIADEYGFTPLHEAAEQGYLEITKLLIEAGADSSKAVVKDWGNIKAGMTPKDIAIQKSHQPVIAYYDTL